MRLTAAGALSVALIAGGTTTAFAETNHGAPQIIRQVTAYFVKNISRTYHVHGSQELARCKAGSSGITCTIGRTYSATRTIQSSYGVSRGSIASGLSISSAHTVSTSVSCARKMKKGESLVAYPIGTKYRYRIAKVVTLGGGTHYSGWLSAFSPGGSSTYCVVR